MERKNASSSAGNTEQAKRISPAICSVKWLLSAVVLIVTACTPPPSDEEPVDERDPQPSESLFFVRGELTGYRGNALELSMGYRLTDGAPLMTESLTLSGDGPFAFSTPLTDGAEFQLFGPPPLIDALKQSCRFQETAPYFLFDTILTGTIAGADATGIQMSCEDYFNVPVSVSGVNELTSQGLAVFLADRGSVRLSSEAVSAPSDGVYEVRYYPDGAAYAIEATVFPTSSGESCDVEDNEGVIDGADATEVTVVCGDRRSIGGTVTGLQGSGLALSLSFASDATDRLLLLDVEQLPIDSNGSFSFETLLGEGDEYRVTIESQPADPTQECELENGEGIVADEDVTSVVVSCVGPRRIYRFSDDYARRGFDDRGNELPGYRLQGESTGPLKLAYEYPTPERSIPLGPISGLSAQEPFVEVFDAERTSGAALYSSPSGRRFWVAVESPLRNIDNNLYSNELLFRTDWRLRKLTSRPSVTLQITRAFLLGHLDQGTFSQQVFPEFTAEIFAVQRTPEGPRTLFSTGSRVLLNLNKFGPQEPYRATLDAVGSSSAEQLLFSATDFVLDSKRGRFVEEGFMLVSDEQVALAELRSPVTVEVDVADLPIGEEFQLTAQIRASARTVSAEGGSAVYFRDPADFGEDSEEPASGFDFVAFEGVEILPFIPEEAVEPDTARPTPTTCGSLGPNPSVLSFAAAEYRIEEAGNFGEIVTVLRDGSLVGTVTAEVSAVSETAQVAVDTAFKARTVVFGDGSGEPRWLDLGIVDDSFDEPEESFLLRLSDPSSCAELGAIAETRIVIAPSDPGPGELAFATDNLSVEEAAPSILVSVARNNGSFRTARGRVEVVGGSAQQGVDYGAFDGAVIFADGETDPLTVAIPLIDNRSPGDQTLVLRLVSDEVSVGEPSELTVTILDDDNRPGTFAFAVGDLSVDEGVPMALDVLRTEGSAGPVTLAIDFEGDSASAEDVDALPSTLSFAAGETVARLQFMIRDDAVAEAAERFVLRLRSTEPAVLLGEPASIAITIVDNDGVTGPPAAPANVRVAAQPSALTFSWDAAESATSYRLSVSADGNGPFETVMDGVTTLSTTIDIATYRVDWPNFLYRVEACNAGGCEAAAALSVADLMLAAIGYFKASNPEGTQQRSPDLGDFFGASVALSRDGSTLAVGTPFEDSNAIFVNGDQSNNSANGSGAVYVFAENNGVWEQQAYLKAPRSLTGLAFGAALALSADGSTLAIGATADPGGATGVDGSLSDSGAVASGAVYLYRRNGGSWLFEHYVKASNTGEGDSFGFSVALDDAGATLAVGATLEDSAATSVNGDELSDAAEAAGAVYLFTRLSERWEQTAYVKASNAEAGDRFGHRVSLSGDGVRLAVSALGEDSAATGVAGDETDNTLAVPGTNPDTGTGAVYLFALEGGVWAQRAYVKGLATDLDDRFGAELALNGDGSVLVVGAYAEDSGGVGVDSGLENDNQVEAAGAAYIYRESSGVWLMDAYLKASNTRSSLAFGRGVAIDASGDTVVLGATGDRSLATGVNGSQAHDSATRVGAAYVFQRLDQQWAQTAYLKAPNSDRSSAACCGRDLFFGHRLAISGDGKRLAIGAQNDASDAAGVGGDQSNENAGLAGSVFLF